MLPIARLLLAVLLLGAGSPVLAADGVIEINQARALAGGVNGSLAADPAGFPVTITQAGSYRLTGNLTVPANTTAILIATGNVTLDLGGFEVKGPNTCTGYPVTSCAAQNGAPGISAPTPNEFLAVVRNGKVIGMAGACIDLQGNSSSVEQVVAFYCGGPAGIGTGAYGRVSKSHSSNNRNVGISVGNGGEAHQNEARGNGAAGVIVGGASFGGIASGNRTVENAGAGLLLFGPVLVSKNVSTANVGSPMLFGVSLGDNLCAGNLC